MYDKLDCDKFKPYIEDPQNNNKYMTMIFTY